MVSDQLLLIVVSQLIQSVKFFNQSINVSLQENKHVVIMSTKVYTDFNRSADVSNLNIEDIVILRIAELETRAAFPEIKTKIAKRLSRKWISTNQPLDII